MTHTRYFCGLLLALLLQGCIHLDWNVTHDQEPVPDGALAQLEPGKDELGRCLQLLGAPHFVWRYRDEGVALAWVSLDSSGLSFDIGFTFVRHGSASFTYGREAANLPGVVLWFGPDLVLERWQRGRMRDLTSGLHHRPAEPDDGG